MTNMQTDKCIILCVFFVYLGTFVDMVIFNNHGFYIVLCMVFSIFRMFSVLHSHHAFLLYLHLAIMLFTA